MRAGQLIPRKLQYIHSNHLTPTVPLIYSVPVQFSQQLDLSNKKLIAV
jgi:hypothetical protein